MKQYKDISYSSRPEGVQLLDIYMPDTAGENSKVPVFLYFHGGGLEAGSRSHVGAFAGYLAEHGIGLVSADYRMYPTAVYPEFLRDAAEAASWVKKHIAEYGGSGRIYVGGSSAGGYISMMLCFDRKYLAPYGIEPSSFAGFIHDAGQPTAHFNVLRERGIDSRRVIIDESAPLYYIGTDLRITDMLFIVSDHDMENRYEQTMLMLSTMKHFRYDMSRVELKVMHGSHCAYVGKTDEQGISVFGSLCADYIESIEAGTGEAK